MIRGRLGTRGLLPAVLACWLASGCSIGPRALENTRLRYNEAVKTTTEEQLLLNIVRLRYTDTPSSLSVSTIAAQFEVNKSVQLTPFFSSSATNTELASFSTLLPQAQIAAADRPTLTLTPQDDQEFTRKLFTPLTLEGVIYLARTTWPIATVFRLWLENLNWVSNAQNASGPTPKQPPEFAEFLAGIEALQRLQDRGQVVFTQEDRAEKLGSPVAAVTPRDQAEAAKNGHEFRKEDRGDVWSLVKVAKQPALRIHPAALGSPDLQTFTRAFHLKPGQTRYEVEVEKLDPFPVNYPPEGVTTLDLETRSLLQVLYFVAQGVEVPPEHVCRGLARITVDGAGQGFDWQQVLGGLFKVNWVKGRHRPPCAAVAVRYLDYWFYIDATDHDTKSTFSLLMELARLELGSKTGLGPTLTLPVGR